MQVRDIVKTDKFNLFLMSLLIKLHDLINFIIFHYYIIQYKCFQIIFVTLLF